MSFQVDASAADFKPFAATIKISHDVSNPGGSWTLTIDDPYNYTAKNTNKLTPSVPADESDSVGGHVYTLDLSNLEVETNAVISYLEGVVSMFFLDTSTGKILGTFAGKTGTGFQEKFAARYFKVKFDAN